MPGGRSPVSRAVAASRVRSPWSAATRTPAGPLPPGGGVTSTTGVGWPAAASRALVTAASGARSYDVAEQRAAPSSATAQTGMANASASCSTGVAGVATAIAAVIRAMVASSWAVTQLGARLQPLVALATDLGPPAEEAGEAGDQQGDARDERDHPHEAHRARHRHVGPRTTAPTCDDRATFRGRTAFAARATMGAMTDPGALDSPRMSPWAPLRHRVFAALFAAQLGSNIGTFFQTVAASWLMGDLTTSPTLVALIQTASLLPLLLLGLPAGALADIFDRRLLLIATQVWMLVCAGVLAALTMTTTSRRPCSWR